MRRHLAPIAASLALAIPITLAIVTVLASRPDQPPIGQRVVWQAPGGKAVTYDDLTEQIKDAGGVAPGSGPEGGDISCQQWLENSLRNSAVEFPNGELFYLQACYAGLKAIRPTH